MNSVDLRGPFPAEHVAKFVLGLGSDLLSPSAHTDSDFLCALDRHDVDLETIADADQQEDLINDEEKVLLHRSILDDFRSHLQRLRKTLFLCGGLCLGFMLGTWSDARYLFVWAATTLGSAFAVAVWRRMNL